jgi:hypothetical protein
VEKFLGCGDLEQGFARVRCPDCAHEFFVAFSCRGRCFCPSCHQKRALQTALWVSQEVCAPVAHRQIVFTIPKRLRIYFRFDRRLTGWAVFPKPPARALAANASRKSASAIAEASSSSSTRHVGFTRQKYSLH